MKKVTEHKKKQTDGGGSGVQPLYYIICHVKKKKWK